MKTSAGGLGVGRHPLPGRDPTAACTQPDYGSGRYLLIERTTGVEPATTSLEGWYPTSWDSSAGPVFLADAEKAESKERRSF